MDRDEIARRVRVYQNAGLFVGKTSKDAAEALYGRMKPVFGSTFEEARAVDLPRTLLQAVEKAQMTHGQIVRELMGVFKEYGQAEDDVLGDQLSERLSTMLDGQENQMNIAFQEFRNQLRGVLGDV
jgi:hypothetical protein